MRNGQILPPIGVHGFIGVFLARKTRARVKSNPIIVYNGLFLGLICGSMLPDVDLFILVLSVIIRFLVQKEDLESAIRNSLHLHRSFTHSLIFIGIGALILFFVAYFMRQTIIAYTTAGIAIGMGIHAILDLYYFTSVGLFFPLGGKILIFPFDIHESAESLQKLVAGPDMFLFDGIFYYYLYRKLQKYTTNLWIKRLKWLAGLASFLTIVFFLFALTSVAIEIYLVILYIFGIPFMVLTMVLPLIIRTELLEAIIWEN